MDELNHDFMENLLRDALRIGKQASKKELPDGFHLKLFILEERVRGQWIPIEFYTWDFRAILDGRINRGVVYNIDTGIVTDHRGEDIDMRARRVRSLSEAERLVIKGYEPMELPTNMELVRWPN